MFYIRSLSYPSYCYPGTIRPEDSGAARNAVWACLGVDPLDMPRNAVNNPPFPISPPSHNHLYIIHLINSLQRFYLITMSLKRPFVPKSTTTPEIYPPSQQLYVTVPESTPPSQNIPPPFSTTICDPPRIYPSLLEYISSFSTTIILCDPPRIYLSLPEYTPRSVWESRTHNLVEKGGGIF